MGGVEVTFSKTSKSPFESMTQCIIQNLSQHNKYMIGVYGWDGVGAQLVVRHVVNTLQIGSNIGPNNPFKRILWLSEDEGLDSMISKRIQEALRTERDVTGEPFRVWWEPLNLPQYSMLVVVDNLHHPINLQRVSMGQYPNFLWPVKILFSSGHFDLISSLESSYTQTWALDLPIHAANIHEKFVDMPHGHALDLLWHEANAAADELSRQEDGIQFFSRDSIMECFLYCTLFPGNFFASQYWLAEGFLHLSGSITMDKAYNMFDLLITNLRERNMLMKLLSSRASLRLVEIAAPLVESVRAIVVAPHSSRFSTSKKNEKFMMEVSKGLEEAPAMERWEEEDVTRISLANNNIKQLQPRYSQNNSVSNNGDFSEDHNILSTILHPPKCPNLITLILSSNPLLQEIKDDFFMWMPNLRVLDLSFTRLLALPPSLTCLSNLRLLTLYSCKELETISPCIETGLQNLEMLDLGSCPLLSMTVASFRQVPNLRILFLNGSSFQKLEVLDLSYTKIEEFPKVSRINTLIRLDLLNTRHLFYVNWKNFARLPPIINWDQCGSGSILPKSSNYPRIFVKDVDVFKWLHYDSPLWNQCFNQFYISISTNIEEQKMRPMPPQRKNPSFPYIDLIPQIELFLQYFHRPPPLLYSRRHLQICGGISPFIDKIEGVLPHVESLYLSNHKIVQNLVVSYPMELRQCEILKCHNLETVLHSKPTLNHASKLANLVNIHLFRLLRLRTFYRGEFAPGSFIQLKRVFLDSCPRIVTVFSSPNIVLEQLQVLVIKLCGKLSQVFGGGALGHKVAPMLSELYLWDLQELRNICEGYLPSLRKVKLRGCTKLRRLPLPPIDSQGNPLKLEITAEYKWWENLNEANKKHIKFKEWIPRTLSTSTRS